MTSGHTIHRDTLERLRAATRRVAPVWPLDRFVAVNPYLGLQDHDFVDAVARLQHVAGARSTMPTRDLRSRVAEGKIDIEDIERAIEEANSALTSEEVLRFLEREGDAEAQEPAAPAVRTVADVVGQTTDVDWSRFSKEHLGGFFATYFDTTFATWQPRREGSLFATWKAEAEIDRTPEIMGAKGFRGVVASLPDSFEDAAGEALARLGVPTDGVELYLHRLLMRVGGWSALAARVAFEGKLHDGVEDDTPVELLTVLLASEAGLLETLGTEEVVERWRHACADTARVASRSPRGGPIEARALAQRAFEIGFQRKLIERMNFRSSLDLSGTAPGEFRSADSRPSAQAVFCIDVRSEVYRRHLEAADPEVETLGFAGFFGFPVEYVPLGHDRGMPQCPVLLKPGYRVAEALGDPDETASALRRRIDRSAVGRAWRSFKGGAVSCFGFVSPLGLTYLPKLITDALGLTRPTPRPEDAGLEGEASARRVELDEGLMAGEPGGIPLADRIELAAGALKGMSLTGDFARLVVLAGHGSSSTNNPHASGLDCGACGGRSGEANARVAAEILNDPRVRRGLGERGIEIPRDTLFVAALHDTTTDEVTVFSRERVPPSHREELAALERSLANAAETCRLDRARRLRAADPEADTDWLRRSRDWAQVRPEWGLAGCGAFVVAPRSRTTDLDLEGRAFLHSYSWEQDEGFSVLELIMTAPMVVASWINLQYYASTVDPHVFGSGNKTLHNVVGGTVGVLEGNGGDLRVGLPWQSIHDGEGFQHEPVRLNVMIEAPIEAMNAIIERHESVRQLLDNGWIHLFALDGEGRVASRYAGDLFWTEVGEREFVGERELVGQGMAWSRAS